LEIMTEIIASPIMPPKIASNVLLISLMTI
jgi:hypothetical protein